VKGCLKVWNFFVAWQVINIADVEFSGAYLNKNVKAEKGKIEFGLKPRGENRE